MTAKTTSQPRIISLILYGGFFIILTKLFYVQVIQNNFQKEKIFQQSYKITEDEPVRGQIISADNVPLAINQDVYLLSIYKPNLKDDLQRVINQIQTVKNDFTDQNKDIINKFIANPNQLWYTFPTQFTYPQTLLLNIPGVEFQHQFNRIYPQSPQTDLLTGRINITNNGVGYLYPGLESYYHKHLTGKTGFSYAFRDALGNTIFPKQSWMIKKVDGDNLRATINLKAQSLAYQKLAEGIKKFQADSGSVTILEPQTGALIAMASLSASESAQTLTVNPAVFNTFEPGSVFKPLVVSMALNEKSINPDFICTDCNRPVTIGEDTINNWNNEVHPDSTLKDIIKNSDNIGMTSIIRHLGLKKFLKYYESLSLSKKTGIDLPGESKPLKKDYWADIDLAAASFGQGFAVTQVKMAQLFNTIANGGYLVQPFVAQSFQQGVSQTASSRKAKTEIFAPSTIEEVKSILQYAVENGSIAHLKPKDLQVCAKSGTAQVAINGQYTDSSTTASYVGFSPCDHPLFTMIVTINNPKSSPWGSSTAAPIWFDIASRLPFLL
jgi:cell division protein FtsI/penicillin-binding protein 2